MLFSHRHVYKFRQRNMFFSEVPTVDLFDFGTKLFNKVVGLRRWGGRPPPPPPPQTDYIQFGQFEIFEI